MTRVRRLLAVTVATSWLIAGCGLAPPGDSDSGPRVAWSTWKDWEELGRALGQPFDAAARAEGELSERLAEHLEEARTEAEKAGLVAGFVAETTRGVD